MKLERPLNWTFDYTVTRSVKPGGVFTPIALALGAVWIVVVTMVNIAAVGYEVVPFTTTIYNSTTSLWYERILPTSWRHQSVSCDGSLLQLNQGCLRPLPDSDNFTDQTY
jgi:hypothetical protein